MSRLSAIFTMIKDFRRIKMILASIKPYYYYLIAEEKKKIEVRKTAFKNLPQDISFYMSKDEKSFAKIPKEFQEKYRKHFGKVGMRVICDKVYSIKNQGNSFVVANEEQGVTNEIARQSCLDYYDMDNYLGNKGGYGWHISDLKIYDKPKELSEFRPICKLEGKDAICALFCLNWKYDGGLFFECTRKVTRPPQSYMFVEEV